MLVASGRIDMFRGFFARMIIELIALDGMMASGLAITADLVETANRLRGQAGRTRLFSLRLSGAGAGVAGAFLNLTVAEADAPPADLLVVPGLGFATPDALAAGLARPDVQAAGVRLAAAVADGAEVAAACSSVFLLAAAGLLDGRRATTSWWLAPVFARMHPQVRLDPDALVVRDGPVTTAGAAMAQMDLMLQVVARHGGPGLAQDCARLLLLDQRSSQARYMAPGFMAAADDRIARAEAWARARLDQPFTAAEMAAAAGLAPRTFARRMSRATGLSPVGFIQRLRLERATELRETTRLSMEEIAARVGYADASTLRRLMRRVGAIGRRG
ncbi:AraC family transcriptional regulator [Tistrella mobilis]|uniref:AraC family transcriptional regulator n=2 Tax=Tistrella mobilis TaxID=171437 RepID=A0A162K5E0_9PROT|nr:AraC family transcriptional regulator [Tistrella mobilis]